VRADDIWQCSATRLARLVREREISAVDATRAALARLEVVNPALGAVVDHRPKDALDRAAQIDAAVARGEDPGPLAGVPVTVKVNVDQVGFATTNGARLQRDLVATENSPVVDNLLRAGAVIIGRTNTPALSYRWFTGNRLHGTTVNPRNPALTPGGSSGGAGAAVAAGIGHVAHGTDVAGSIRYPAYACGVHGLRPGLGRVAAFNPSSPERRIGYQLMSVSGPLARHVADLRLAFAVMTWPDPRDPWWTPAPLAGPPVPRRVALCVRPDGLDTQPEVERALRDAAARLVDDGWVIEELDALPPLRELCRDQIALWMGDGYPGYLEAAEQEGDEGALVALRGQAAVAAEVATSEDLSAVLTRRATMARRWRVFLAEYPVVLLPACAELPFPADLDLAGPEAYARVWEAQIPMVAPPFVGLPGLVVSTGVTRGPYGPTPIGVQVLADRFREDLCLDAAEAIERGGTPDMPAVSVARAARPAL
jgi:amidase